MLRHPAKFPETLASEFIEFFTKRGGVVLDPMAGTGSALVAALRADGLEVREMTGEAGLQVSAYGSYYRVAVSETAADGPRP